MWYIIFALRLRRLSRGLSYSYEAQESTSEVYFKHDSSSGLRAQPPPTRPHVLPAQYPRSSPLFHSRSPKSSSQSIAHRWRLRPTQSRSGPPATRRGPPPLSSPPPWPHPSPPPPPASCSSSPRPSPPLRPSSCSARPSPL
jgi:hypothetical protein